MTRRRRTRVLIQGEPSLRMHLAAQTREYADVFTVSEPAAGLVMNRMRDTAQKMQFYLGEVLVTECKVQINGHLGLGILTGDDEQAALDLAIIDAAFAAQLEITRPWIELLEAEELRISGRRAQEEARILETRVDFQTMDSD